MGSEHHHPPPPPEKSHESCRGKLVGKIQQKLEESKFGNSVVAGVKFDGHNRLCQKTMEKFPIRGKRLASVSIFIFIR